MITANEIKRILLRKGVNHLFHSNSVLTALTFFSVGGLLSRGEVVDRNLLQTKQRSDELDKQYGIWYDIFFDSIDIHDRSSNLNQYGPVLFVYNIDVLDFHQLPIVKVTKANPVHWGDIYSSERYFNETYDLNLGFRKGNFGQHITLTNTKDVIPFSNYLEEIIIDDPRLDDNRIFVTAKDRLSEEIDRLRLDTRLSIRDCKSSCKCIESYHKYSSGVIWYKYTLDARAGK